MCVCVCVLVYLVFRTLECAYPYFMHMLFMVRTMLMSPSSSLATVVCSLYFLKQGSGVNGTVSFNTSKQEVSGWVLLQGGRNTLN